uniref:cytochrome c oxidase subunit III n=1 Tax=Tropilaelaps mercedesae TaxID=418985 RepID=UPI0028D0E9FD|nr:cytochrome c oxidase subunit III [Tropilaelaps mercedesae]WMV02016.1 cytochrome c oxidase subunit III [Tropilaelaps mercedesae]
MMFQPFHLVSNSPWPILSSLNSLFSMINFILLFHNMNSSFLLLLNMILWILILFQWWRDVIRENLFQGSHTTFSKKNFKLGMMMFICSEIFFFIGFFWSFFHNSLSPDLEIGLNWPPKGIQPFNPYNIPLLNTIILLSSGLTITWTHHSLISKNWNQTFSSLILTIILGVYFSILQIIEYKQSPFTIADSIFGSTFFLSTGFHGIHVFIGTCFLTINLIRLMNFHLNKMNHISLELAIWYWHFVDVVWIFLYSFIYWWIY